MKSKTIKRHIIVLEDREVKIIYRALQRLENENSLPANGKKLEELREEFYKLIKPEAAYVRTSRNH
jgi:hypothetical protein